MRSRADGGALAMTTTEATRRDGALAALARALETSGARARLSGTIESEHEFPLDSTSTATLAVALMQQTNGGASARWRAYCDALPAAVDSLMMWSDEELEVLQGSALRQRAVFRRDLCKREYDALFPALARADPETFGDVEAYSFDVFRWAYATVMARAFVLPDLQCMALLPGLDIYNSARDAEKCVVERDEGACEVDDSSSFDESEARVTLRVGVGGVQAGSQLFHDYADHASGGALLEFGFVYHGERERGSGVDALDVCLKPALARLDARSRAFLVDEDVFHKFNVRKSLTFEISNVGGVYKPALKGIECIKPEMWRAARALALRPDEPLPSSLDARLDDDGERRARDILIRVLRDERERYSATTIDEDIDLLRRASDGGPSRRREAMALDVRLGEKLLLDDVVASLLAHPPS
ncbi:Rubisco LS methyltransferase, substrate-binding domain [Ostreococcus tauri]|nr:Rubisco LS methyltransferase, substrate-binding domain [Ostreococcus tauri]CEF99584.1 Rubisco LS methyltransferase, substrate-binding domain [Ostreococcus tauri]|eukprot:XP_003081920.2 Rubisco LS methyltransferase, substrate-binding domain [Ostreococcus tauri]